jgi:SpoIID/LytB domain protein
VRITYDGAYRVTPLVSGQSSGTVTAYQQDCSLLVICPTTTTAPAPTTPTTAPSTSTTRPSGGGGGGSPTTDAPPSSPGATATSSTPVLAVPAGGGVTRVDDRARTYRGAVEANAGGGFRLINIVGVEDYLRGMAEVPGTWPAAALQAQTIAARTYALRAMQSGGEICDDARCQVYVGATAESAGQNAAVAATSKRVITYGGKLAAAVYSAEAGGVSANEHEGFGTPDSTYPYLRNVAYEIDDPMPWKLVVGLDDVARRAGYPGSVTGARVSEAGPSDRALAVTLEGSAGDRTVDGRAFARSLGLRSTRFTAELGTADGRPLPPPPAEEAIQALPDEASALARLPIAPSGGVKLERSEVTGAGIGPGDLPAAIDPRRHPATLLAVLLAAFVLGGAIPVAMAHGVGAGEGAARWSARWRVLRRSR